MPAAVAKELSDLEQQIVQTGARHSVVAMLIWFAFVPLVFLMGVLRWDYMVLILAPATVVILLCLLVARQRITAYWPQLGVVAGTLVAAMALTRMYGPFVLVPSVIATFAIVVQAHPSPMIRTTTVVMACLALLTPPLLELVGLLPASYAVEAGRITVLPQMHELPPVTSTLLLVTANLALTLVPCIFIGKLRGALTSAQSQVHVHLWHFRRLSDELISAGRSS